MTFYVDSCMIGGRDKEIEQIIKIFSKRQYRNVLIYGTSGVGKKSFVEKLVYTFSSDNFDKLYGDYRFLKLNVSRLVAKSKREAREYATEVIYDNMDLAQHLVEELIAKGILVKSEIDEFFKKQD